MEFLKYFEGSVFQTFKDRPDAKGYPQVFFEYDEQRFESINQGGCGIYFTPNFFKGGRKEENLIYINAVFADVDLAKEGQMYDKGEMETKKLEFMGKLEYLELPPNFVIHTKNGLQPIWRVFDGEVSEESKKKFKTILGGIIQLTKGMGSYGDQVKDLSRVLRLPGFYHMKSDPFLCTVTFFHDEKFYLDQLLEFFPFQQEEKKVDQKFLNGKPVEKGLVFIEIEKIPIEELAVRAFAYVGRSASFDKQKRLILDGRLTGTFVGKTGDGFMASSSHEPFKGNRVTVVASILKVTNSEAYVWIREQYGLDEKKLKVEKDFAEKVEIIQKPTKKYYSWGTDGLTHNFGPIKRDTYSIIGASSGVGKTTFCLNMAFKNADLGHKVLYVSLEMTKKDLFEHLARKAANQTIWEEIYDEIPGGKKTRYQERLDELENKENLTIRGISGQSNITFEYLEKLMEGDWDLIFVDNFNLIVKENGKNQYEHEGELSSKFVTYAYEKQTPLVVVHHYSKAGHKETMKTSYSLSGNAKIVNDAHRIVLLERKYFEEDDEPTPKDRSRMKVTLDKCRGYDGGVRRVIYFYHGEFFDEYPGDDKPQVQSDLFN